MRIALNLRIFNAGRIGGLETVVRSLVRGLEHQPPAAEQELTIYAPERQRALLRSWSPSSRYVASEPNDPPEALEQSLTRGDFDLLLCPLLTLEPLYTDVPCAVWIPDLLHEFLPEFFSADQLAWRRRGYRSSALHADLIFTLSEHAKASIVERFHVEPEKVRVVPPPITADSGSAEAADEFTALELPDRFLLFPANFWPHKNHRRLLQALSRLRQEGHEPPLTVLTGSDSSGFDEIHTEIESMGLADHVRYVGYLNQAVLRLLYKHASALLFVSMFEGFGIPIIEAFDAGTPVVASNRASCPEIAGDAALLVDPEDVGAIAAAIRRVLTDNSLRAELIERGKARAIAFTKRNVYIETRGALAEIGQAPPRSRSADSDLVGLFRPELAVPDSVRDAAARMPGFAGFYAGQKAPYFDPGARDFLWELQSCKVWVRPKTLQEAAGSGPLEVVSGLLQRYPLYRLDLPEEVPAKEVLERQRAMIGARAGTVPFRWFVEHAELRHGGGPAALFQALLLRAKHNGMSPLGIARDLWNHLNGRS